jgi:hypothetical protein
MRVGCSIVMLFLATSPRTAAAQEPSCTRVRVMATDALASEWAEAAEALRVEVQRLQPADCPEVDLSLAATASGVSLVATAQDGRRAERPVARPKDLVTVAMGLLAAAPPEPIAPKPSPPPTAQEVPPADQAKSTPAEPVPPATLAISVGGRYAAPTNVLAPEIELRGDIRFSGYLVAFSGRGVLTGYEIGGGNGGAFDYNALSFGVLFGRRFVAGRTAFDLAIGPRLGTSTLEGSSEASGGTVSDLTIEAAARVSLPIGGSLRPTVALSAEGAPGRVRHAAHADGVPAFPAWGAAIHLGIAKDVP